MTTERDNQEQQMPFYVKASGTVFLTMGTLAVLTNLSGDFGGTVIWFTFMLGAAIMFDEDWRKWKAAKAEANDNK